MRKILIASSFFAAALALAGCQTIGYDGYALSDCTGTIDAGNCTISWGGGLAPPPGVETLPAAVVAQPAPPAPIEKPAAPAPETGEPPATDPSAPST